MESGRTLMGTVTLVVPTLLVWAVTPASWIFLVYHHYRAHAISLYGTSSPVKGRHWFYSVALWHAYLEVPFSLFLLYLSRKAQRRRRLKGASVDEMRSIFLECLEVGIREQTKEQFGRRGRSGRTGLTKDEVERARGEAAATKFRQWFFDAPLKDIWHGNAYEWVAWAMVDCSPSELAPQSSEEKLVNEGLEWVQHRLHHTFTPGFNPNVKSIRLSIDPVKSRHRPLGYYVVCCSTTFVMYAYLLANGCRFERHGACTFLTRPAKKFHNSRDPRSLPILFVHGLGIGLGQYAVFSGYLLAKTQPLMILIQPNISAQIYDPRFLDPPGKLEHVEAFKAICASKEYDEVTVLSHSNGTMVHGWLLRGAPELCRRNILADPVSFRLWEADVCYTFLHKPWNTPLEILLGYFVARELGTAHTIARLFVWTDMMLWEHEIPYTDPESLQIILGSDDFLIDAPNVMEYLRSAGVRDDCITLVSGAPHGAALIVHAEGMKKVLTSL